MSPNIKTWLSSDTLKEGMIMARHQDFRSGPAYRLIAFTDSSITLEEATSKDEKEILTVTEEDPNVWVQITAVR